MARYSPTIAMGRASSNKFLLAHITLLICTGWILNCCNVMGLPIPESSVTVIDRDNRNEINRAGFNNTTDQYRDKIETETGPTPISSPGDSKEIDGTSPILVVPDFLQNENNAEAAADEVNASHGENESVAERHSEGRAIPEIEYEAGLMLRCAAKGHPQPNLTWELNDGHLPHYIQKTGLKYSHPQGSNEEIDQGNSHKHNDKDDLYWVDLRLPKLNNAFYGRLRCRAANGFGNVTWEVEIIHNANSSVLMKIVRIIFAGVFFLVAVLLVKAAFWLDDRHKQKLYEKLPPQDLEIINRFKKGLAPPPASPSSSICQSNAMGLGTSCVGGIEITVTRDPGDAAMKEGYRLVKDQSSSPDLPKKLLGSGSGGATPTSCTSVHVLDAVNSWANYVPYDDKFETSSQHFKVDFSTILENGSYGMVFAGKIRNDLTMEWSTVAAKSGKTERDDNFLLESILTELKILASLPRAHDNIVNLRGASTKLLHKRQAFVFVDYCKNGPLASFIDLNRQFFHVQGSNQKLNPSNNNSVTAINSEDSKTGLDDGANASFHRDDKNEGVIVTLEDFSPPQQFTSKELLAWSWQIADGMNFLHRNRVIHGNLSTASIYVTASLTCKIGNIGCPPAEESAQCIDSTTKKWLAVPSFSGDHFSKKSDVWDFGRVLWEIFSLRGQQFPGRAAIAEFLREDAEGNEDSEIEVPDFATPEIFELMLCCWNEDGTLSPEFDFLTRAFKQLSKDVFPSPSVDGASTSSSK